MQARKVIYTASVQNGNRALFTIAINSKVCIIPLQLIEEPILMPVHLPLREHGFMFRTSRQNLVLEHAGWAKGKNGVKTRKQNTYTQPRSVAVYLIFARKALCMIITLNVALVLSLGKKLFTTTYN